MTDVQPATGPESRVDTLQRLCANNLDAVRLIEDAWRFADVFDDAIDGEKKQTDAEIYRSFLWALFELHRNAFYVAHRDALELAFRVAIAEWMTANRLERSGDREQLITAYTLRCSPYTFFVAVVLAAGGPEAADEAAHMFRSMATEDRLDDYLREHGVEV
jgi:hypothetical protein